MHKIPTISFNDLKSANPDVLDFLTDCLRNNGFFVINEHPIDLSLIDRTFSIAEEMFALPYDVKKQYHAPGTNGARGYTPSEQRKYSFWWAVLSIIIGYIFNLTHSNPKDLGPFWV